MASSDPTRVVDSPKIWACLITNTNYLPGLLTLHHTLTNVFSTQYPLVALTSPSLPQSALDALTARSIPHQPVPFLQPASEGQQTGGGGGGDQAGLAYSDPRFRDTWTKLAVFGLTGYDRIVLLDADMLPLKSMDELLDDAFLPLDAPPEHKSSSDSSSTRVLAACHACTCNPFHRPHYPDSWVPANCGLTALHASPSQAQISGGSPGPLGVLNSGLLVLRPSATNYALIHQHMHDHGHKYIFPDQDVIANTFPGRWVPLPYVYNALKPMRFKGVHDAIWRDESVKNVHYILAPKPWDRDETDEKNEQNEMDWWWIEANKMRKVLDKQRGIDDGF
ncbi:glycosyl transferase family 8 domain-containing protein [Sarocladium implicatum]|nr:glycosyl transferase family 8 domain-containing protein [Sarocladium implicatum]